MKKINKIAPFCYCIMAIVLILHFLGQEAFASEKTSNLRFWWDLFLRYINFGILVFVFVKYLKTPLMNFLQGRKEKLAQEIKRLEDEKEDLTVKIKEHQETIAESEVRFAELKERIVKQGERKKQEIIESAQQQSRMMLEDADRRLKTYFLQAENAFKAELIDAAIELAMQRLPKEITAEDNEKFANEYLAGTLAE